MKSLRTVRLAGVTPVFLFVAALPLGPMPAQQAMAQWTQFGGPGQGFKSDSTGLATSWPEGGPKKLWSRSLGEGYSGITVNDGTLYTMYRAGDEEIVCALRSADGTTAWEQRYTAAPAQGHVMEFNAGPRSTPLVIDGDVVTIGVSGIMHCLDAKDGKVKWKHDLWTEFEGNKLNHGYASSPIAYKDLVIALVGGKGHSVVAFKRANGEVAWKQHDFDNSYSTPRLMTIGGEEHLVCAMAHEIVGLNPADGSLRWRYEVGNQYGQNILMPEQIADDLLFISTMEAGARGLKVIKDGDKYKTEEAWTTRKVQFHHVNAVHVGDFVYGSIGSGPNFISAINGKTGDLAWRERGIPKANVVFADGKLIILDEEGNLTLASATPEKFTVLAKALLLGHVAWTPPTLVGKTMYLRDCKQIMALDLG
jgi:outer membrane protein assembly factor BamB